MNHMHSSQTISSLPARTPRPVALPPLPGLDLRARYQSARTGGDFFDAVTVGQHVVFLLTDIAGTRADAHTIAAATQDIFLAHTPQIFGSPEVNPMDAIAALAQEINHAIISASHGVRFAPTFFGCFDLSLGILTYLNAGGQPALLRDADGTRILGSASVPLGLFTHLTYEPAIQAFEPGACLLLVTKGVVEASRGRSHFGTDGVLRILKNFSPGSALDLCQTTLQQADHFRKPPWHLLPELPFLRRARVEDLTAVALVRPPS
jgi:serine phosphatase RsbU (regulator of sigma subunit)